MDAGEHKGPKMSRRGFGKLVGKALVAGTGAALGAKVAIEREAQTLKEGIGTFYHHRLFPLYEQHNIGVKPEQFPKVPIDLLFREVVARALKGYTMRNSLETGVLAAEAGSGERINVPTFPLELLQQLSENAPEEGTAVMMGDILVTPDLTDDDRFRTIIQESFGTAAFLLGHALGPDTKKAVPEPKPKGFSRRFFLRKGTEYALKLGAVWAMSPALINIERAFRLDKMTDEQNAAARRVISRIEGFSSNLHPENPFIFFRNLLMAYKIQLVSNQIGSERGRKLNDAGIFGEEHTGLEDLLQLSKEQLLSLITAYPPEYLRYVASLNDGPDYMAGFALFLLKPDKAAGKKTKKEILDNAQEWMKTQIVFQDQIRDYYVDPILLDAIKDRAMPKVEVRQ